MKNSKHGSALGTDLETPGASARASRVGVRTVAALRVRTASCLAAVTLVISIALAAGPAAADQYDSKVAGHPLRIVAYVIHPVGELLELLIMRPAHWIITREPVKALVGHTD